MCLPALIPVGMALGASAGSAATVGSVAAMAGGSALMGAYSAYQSASAQKAAANAQAQIATNNAKAAGWAAKDATDQGETAVMDSNRKTDQMLGTQRAALASSGVLLTGGSASNILEDTQVFGQIDANTIRNNAARTAWGYRTQQSNDLATATMAKSQAKQINPVLSAGTSLLNSGTQLASMWVKGGM